MIGERKKKFRGMVFYGGMARQAMALDSPAAIECADSRPLIPILPSICPEVTAQIAPQPRAE